MKVFYGQKEIYSLKCLNCSGTEFEKAEQDGKFTTSFEYRSRHHFSSEKTVVVPRYFHACLGCGLVHQVLDLDARRVEMKNLIDFALKDQLTEPNQDYSDFVIARVSVKEMSEKTNIPKPIFDELLKEMLLDHRGYDTFQSVRSINRVVPVLNEDGSWIIGKKILN